MAGGLTLMEIPEKIYTLFDHNSFCSRRKMSMQQAWNILS